MFTLYVYPICLPYMSQCQSVVLAIGYGNKIIVFGGILAGSLARGRLPGLGSIPKELELINSIPSPNPELERNWN